MSRAGEADKPGAGRASCPAAGWREWGRCAVAFGGNVVAPGVGLILLRRDALGLVVALLFVLLSQVALWGLLLVPAEMPAWAAWLGAGGAAAVWLGAQVLIVRRWRTACGPAARAQLALLVSEAEEALDDGRHIDARELLELATALNDEDVEVRVRWARLMLRTGRLDAARRGWLHVLRQDRSGVHHAEATEALAQIGGPGEL